MRTVRIEMRDFANRDLDIVQGFISMVYTETTYGFASYTLRAVAKDWSLWNQVLQDWGRRPCRLRWGYEDEDGEHWTPWRRVRVAGGQFTILPGSTLGIGIESVCAGFSLRSTFKETIYKDKKLSDMVKEIAARNQLKTDVAATRDKHTLYQCALTDGRFIVEEVLPRAVGADGRTDYQFWVREGTHLVFRPPKTQQKPILRFYRGPSKSPSDALPLLKDPIVDYGAWRLPVGGHLSTRYRGYNPLRKEPVFWRATDDSVDYPVLASVPPPVPKQDSAVRLVTEPSGVRFRDQEVEHYGRSDWSQALRLPLRMRVVVPPVLINPLGRVAEALIQDMDKQDRWCSGRYVVYGMVTRLKRVGADPKATGTAGATEIRYDTELLLERRAMA